MLAVCTSSSGLTISPALRGLPCSYGLSGPPPAGSHTGSNCRLELVGSWQCWGVVQDMAALRGRGNSGQRDSIIIAVRYASHKIDHRPSCSHLTPALNYK